MSDTAIRVEKLSKRYRIGQREGYRALRDVMTNFFSSPLRRRSSEDASRSNGRNWFWALKDASFEIKHGEIVGIIGRNGAGKSTLLKILSRITQPTEGRVEIYGRVGSLLEVGTGFHPELTGRENIFLNGAILGMKRSEIDRKFDEIVAFAEIEKFLDTPVKYYSSGMYIRLAFAVAAHLEPEVLLVDEVLAVGDAAFQKKCLGKMDEVAKSGRTVIYVSHQMNSIRMLCTTCIWLDSGKIQMVDRTIKTVSAYESSLMEKTRRDPISEEERGMPARFLSWEIVSPKEEQPNLLTVSGPLTMKVCVRINQPVRNGCHGLILRDAGGSLMWGWAIDIAAIEPGIYEFIYQIPGFPLRPGIYGLYVSLYSQRNLRWDEWHCIPELIIATPPLAHASDEWCGILNIPCEFDMRERET